MLLFLVFGSGVDENALPVSVSVLPAPTESLTVMVTVTLAPFARLPILQLKVPAVPTTGAVHVPALVVKPAKVVPTGVASETTVRCPAFIGDVQGVLEIGPVWYWTRALRHRCC
jgi:hypothetical protein